MDENHLTTEDLDNISALQAKKDAETHYTERPKSQRVLAWICICLLPPIPFMLKPRLLISFQEGHQLLWHSKISGNV